MISSVLSNFLQAITRPFSLLLLLAMPVMVAAQANVVKKLDPDQQEPGFVDELIVKKVDTLLLDQLLPSYRNLKVLDISYSKFSIFPEVICKLDQLIELRLGGNELVVIPDCICKLNNLVKLELWDNNVYKFPDCLNDMPYLKELDLSGMEYNHKEQDELRSRFPYLKIRMSLPCNCHFD